MSYQEHENSIILTYVPVNRLGAAGCGLRGDGKTSESSAFDTECYSCVNGASGEKIAGINAVTAAGRAGCLRPVRCATLADVSPPVVAAQYRPTAYRSSGMLPRSGCEVQAGLPGGLYFGKDV